jgi:hypothetical protein
MQRRDFLLGAMAAPLEKAEWTGLIAAIERQTPKLMDDFQVPGVSVAIVRTQN